MASLTSRGLRVLTDWMDGASTPAALAVILTTDLPTFGTKDTSELTEVANGNGYTTGGISVALDATDWPTETESDTAGQQYFERLMKSQAWAASGGNIPASGGVPLAVVLIDDAGTPNVLGWIDLGTAKTIVSGLSLTMPGMSMRIGGDLVTLPAQQEEGTATITPGNGSKGAYAQVIASTAFNATTVQLTVEQNANSGQNPIQFDIATGAASSEVDIFNDITLQVAGVSEGDKVLGPYDFNIASGARLSVRAQATGGTSTSVVQISITGP